MRIAFVISSLRQGGPVTVLANLTKALASLGHTCKVFYFDAGEEVHFVCPTERVPFFRSFKFSDYDVIHVNGIRSNYYASIHIPPRQRRHYVVISTVHAYTLEEFSLAYSPVKAYLFNLLFMWSLRRHDCVVALSKNMRQYLTKWIKPEKITWAYNGIDTELIDSIEGNNLGNFFQKGDVRLICNSALVKLKRVDLAIRSQCYLPPHFKLWINGDGPLRRQLESLCMDLHVADRVHFAGQVMNPISYLKQMNVFIQCSMTEGFCLAMAEAAACRLNIVSSDIPGMREKYSDSEVRYFRISSSDEASAQRLAVEIVQANEQKDLGERARKKVEDQFSLKQMGLRYEQIFERVLNQENHRK